MSQPRFSTALAVLVCLSMTLGACGVAPKPVHHAATQKTFGGSRPVTISVPTQYNNDDPTPLLILLHGYGASGAEETAYLEIDNLVEEAGIIFAAPDGTPDSSGSRFWNATDACCNFGKVPVDDVGYIASLITDISAEWNVDPKRVYLMGHSNGGFMSYRMACEKADLLAGIVVLAGETYADTATCHPSRAVNLLHIQGTADNEILYGGGQITVDGMTWPPYPGALQSVQTWAGYDHCSTTLASAGPNLDLDSVLVGAETTQQHESSCPSGVDVALWTIVGGSHLPNVTTDFHTDVWRWMAAHPQK
jgi:polyhydroxybutyrate depolymerase